MQEDWKVVDDFENYEVSNLGRVRNKHTKELRVPQDRDGYLQVKLFKNAQYKHFYLHRLVAQAFLPNPHNYQFVDHIDRVIRNNIAENLRWCSRFHNNSNREKNCNNKSGYKGVHWRKDSKMWRAVIGVDYKRVHLGNFQNIEDAAKAYNEAAIKYFGEFAALNDLTPKQKLKPVITLKQSSSPM